MPRRLEHTYGGIVASMGVATISTRELPPAQAVAESIGLVLGGAFGGRLPDQLEPAYHPNHRHFAHSAALGTSIALVLSQFGPQIRGSLRQTGNDLLEVRDQHPLGSWQWYGLGILVIAAFVLAGAVVGVPVGYLSHLGLDHVKSSRGIPLLV